jgi:hypothetical protein
MTTRGTAMNGRFNVDSVPAIGSKRALLVIATWTSANREFRANPSMALRSLRTRARWIVSKYVQTVALVVTEHRIDNDQLGALCGMQNAAPLMFEIAILDPQPRCLQQVDSMCAALPGD